jgi:hypothetical protein
MFSKLSLLFTAAACDSDLGSHLFLSSSDWQNVKYCKRIIEIMGPSEAALPQTLASDRFTSLHFITSDVYVSPREGDNYELWYLFCALN